MLPKQIKSELILQCECDICQCFNNSTKSLEKFNVKCKIDDYVKIWNRIEGLVQFIGRVEFLESISIVLIGVQCLKPISKITLNDYSLYCEQTNRLLVPSAFVTLMGPGIRGHPKINHFPMNPSYSIIQKNRKLYHNLDPLLYELRLRPNMTNRQMNIASKHIVKK